MFASEGDRIVKASVLRIFATTVAVACLLVGDSKTASPEERSKKDASNPKNIKDRFVQPVAGIDLEQSLKSFRDNGHGDRAPATPAGTV